MKLFARKGAEIQIWGQLEGGVVTTIPIEKETLKSINAAKRRSRELQKQGLRFERRPHP